MGPGPGPGPGPQHGVCVCVFVCVLCEYVCVFIYICVFICINIYNFQKYSLSFVKETSNIPKKQFEDRHFGLFFFRLVDLFQGRICMPAGRADSFECRSTFLTGGKLTRIMTKVVRSTLLNSESQEGSQGDTGYIERAKNQNRRKPLFKCIVPVSDNIQANLHEPYPYPYTTTIIRKVQIILMSFCARVK